MIIFFETAEKVEKRLTEMKPDIFKIAIENDLYFPGSIVKGFLSITTNASYCGNLSIKLEGKSCSTGQRNNIFHKRYAFCKRVLWGEIFVTPIFESIFDIRQNGECLLPISMFLFS